MRIVVIVNQKGGCGKTTTAINLSGIFAAQGKRTLLVDMDPQSHCAAGLAIPEQRIDLDIGDAMLADTPVDPNRLLWRVGRNLDLAPSRMKLAGLEAARGGLASKPDKERRLAKALGALSDRYDVCCVDCSPSIGLLTYNALAAANEVILPVETSFFSLQGAVKQANTIASLGKRLGVMCPYWVLATIHDTESGLARDLFEELQRRFGERVIPTPIRRDLKLKEAASFGQPIVEYSPTSVGTEDYAALAGFLLEKWDQRTETETKQSLPTQSHSPSPEVKTIPTQDSELTRRVTGNEPPRTLPAQPTPSRAEEISALARRLRESALATGNTPTPGSMGSSGSTATAAAPVSTGTVVATAVAPARPHPVTIVQPEDASLAAFSPRRDILESPVGLSATELKPTRTKPTPGVRLTSQGTLFVQPLESARSIHIAGDFNGWSPASHPMRRNEAAGVYELCIDLPPGRHAYRLVVDGSWVADPHNPLRQPNEFNESNSFIDVL